MTGAGEPSLPTVIEVAKLVHLIQGQAPHDGEALYRARYWKTRRWLDARKVSVASVGRRRVVYLADLRDAWPELWDSVLLAARARAKREPCEHCGVVPECDCR